MSVDSRFVGPPGDLADLSEATATIATLRAEIQQFDSRQAQAEATFLDLRSTQDERIKQLEVRDLVAVEVGGYSPLLQYGALTHSPSYVCVWQKSLALAKDSARKASADYQTLKATHEQLQKTARQHADRVEELTNAQKTLQSQLQQSRDRVSAMERQVPRGITTRERERVLFVCLCVCARA